MVGDLRQRIEPVDGREDLAPLFGKECLGRPPDRLAVIDDQNLETLELRVAAGHGQATPSLTTALKERRPLNWPHGNGGRTASKCSPGFNISVYPKPCNACHVF